MILPNVGAKNPVFLCPLCGLLLCVVCMILYFWLNDFFNVNYTTYRSIAVPREKMCQKMKKPEKHSDKLAVLFVFDCLIVVLCGFSLLLSVPKTMNT